MDLLSLGIVAAVVAAGICALKLLPNTEPVAVGAAVQASLGVLMAFGLKWTPEQIAVVMALSGALLALFVRHQVSPVEVK